MGRRLLGDILVDEPFEQPVTAFHCQFWRLYGVTLLWAIVSYTLIFSVIFLILELDIRLAPAKAFALALSFSTALTVVLLVPCTFLLIMLMQVRVSREGLKSGDLFGRPLDATWGAITTVRPIYFLGFHYLRIQSNTTRRVIWLPVFLVDFERFAGLVRKLAGPEHPLTVATATRLQKGA